MPRSRHTWKQPESSISVFGVLFQGECGIWWKTGVSQIVVSESPRPWLITHSVHSGGIRNICAIRVFSMRLCICNIDYHRRISGHCWHIWRLPASYPAVVSRPRLLWGAASNSHGRTPRTEHNNSIHRYSLLRRQLPSCPILSFSSYRFSFLVPLSSKIEVMQCYNRFDRLLLVVNFLLWVIAVLQIVLPAKMIW